MGLTFDLDSFIQNTIDTIKMYIVNTCCMLSDYSTYHCEHSQFQLLYTYLKMNPFENGHYFHFLLQILGLLEVKSTIATANVLS